MTNENGGRETGPLRDAVAFDAVWEAMDAVRKPDDDTITEKHVREFLDDLEARGYVVVMCQCSIVGDNTPGCPAHR